MQIRKSSRSDADSIGEVDVQAFLDSGWGQAHAMSSDEDLQRRRREESSEFCLTHPEWVYVAEDDDRVVGFVSFEYEPKSRIGHIENNATLPEFRNRGISTQLVQHAVSELSRLGAHRIQLRTIHVSAALRVYEKAGFRLAKRVHEPDSEGGPAATMHYYEMRVQ
jgi:ribosomal protein S18 acetylase RimI-like enzyme